MSLSEQHLVDCDTYDNGCNGGWMDSTYNWIRLNGGLCLNADYTYTGTENSCPATPCANPVAEIVPTSTTSVTADSITDLEAASAQSVVGVAVAVGGVFSSYQSGVFTGSCGSSINHGVVLVGYGTEGSTDYWTIKNSWGTGWGDGGYMKILKDDSDLCMLMDACSFPVI